MVVTKAGAGGFVLNLHPQPPDVDVDDLHLAQVVLAPDAAENLLPGEGLAGFSMNIFMMAYSTWVSLIRWPLFSKVRFRVLRTKGAA